MDPLTALGLASNVVQFVDFAVKILSSSAEIARSAQGGSELGLELDRVYSKLEDFASRINPIGSANTPLDAGNVDVPDALARRHEEAIRQHVATIKEISSECNIVCGQLLGIVRDLRVGNAQRLRRFKSLAVALKAALRSNKLSDLEERLKRYQALLTLHFFPLLDERQRYMTRLLESVRSRHRSMELLQATRFDDLTSRLQAMSGDIKVISRRLASPKATRAPLDSDDVKRLGDILSGLQLTEDDIGLASQEQEVLKSLDFAEKEFRHEAICEAHKSTFEWIFSDQSSSSAIDPVPSRSSSPANDPASPANDPASPANDPASPANDPASPANDPAAPANDPVPSQSHPAESTRCDFMGWLQSGKGVFWISGKPGAGKSTLMKFIADHANTRAVLEAWAGTKDVVISSHYFWAAGAENQKSLRGLLQKMVFDVLRQCPKLAWDIFPDRCKERRAFSLPANGFWSLKELGEALKRLSRLPALPVRCCFFIDGLDEYSGDHIELCKMIQEFTKDSDESTTESDKLKYCVSSRPWNVFTDAFGSNKSRPLWVHELTHNDIYSFARDQLTNVPGEKDTSVNEDAMNQLAQLVADRAEGVFLWVFLVTKALRQGIANCDTMDELKSQLTSVPNELEPYFKHMLGKVPKIHQHYMAQTLQVALAAKRPHRLDVYCAREHEEKDANYVLATVAHDNSRPVMPSTKDCSICRRRINERCGGLLCITKQGVEFIHRTVHSFLLTGEMQDHLVDRVKPGFHPNLSTIRALLYSACCEFAKASNADRCRYRWPVYLRYLDDAMREDQESTFQLIDGFANAQPGSLASGFVMAWKNHLRAVSLHRGPSSEGLPSRHLKGILLKPKYHGYAIARLRQDPNYFGVDGISALGTVLYWSDIWGEKEKSPMMSMIVDFLEAGCEPNEPLANKQSGYVSMTPWEELISKFWSSRSVRKWGVLAIPAFLKHGARRTALVTTGQIHPFTHFLDSVLKRVGQKYDEAILNSIPNIVAVFLDTSREENTAQLKDVFRIIASFDWGFSLTISISEKLLLEAIEVRMCSADLAPVLDILPRISPDVRNAVEDYLASISPETNTSLKRPREDVESEDGHDSTRLRTRDSWPCDELES